jgi:hypothetical protein
MNDIKQPISTQPQVRVCLSSFLMDRRLMFGVFLRSLLRCWLAAIGTPKIAQLALMASVIGALVYSIASAGLAFVRGTDQYCGPLIKN